MCGFATLLTPRAGRTDHQTRPTGRRTAAPTRLASGIAVRAYYVGSIVKYGDYNYIGVLAGTNQAPPNTAYWAPFNPEPTPFSGEGHWSSASQRATIAVVHIIDSKYRIGRAAASDFRIWRCGHESMHPSSAMRQRFYQHTDRPRRCRCACSRGKDRIFVTEYLLAGYAKSDDRGHDRRGVRLPQYDRDGAQRARDGVIREYRRRRKKSALLSPDHGIHRRGFRSHSHEFWRPRRKGHLADFVDWLHFELVRWPPWSRSSASSPACP